MDVIWLSQDCSGFWLADSLFPLPAWLEQMSHLGRGRTRGARKYECRPKFMLRQEDLQCWWTPQYQKERPFPCRVSHQPGVSWRRGLKRQRGWERWGGHWGHHQPDSWPRWLQRPGQLCQEGRSQSRGSSNLPWEARPLQKEFLRAGKVKKPWKDQPGTVALHKIHCFQKSMDLLICKLPFSHLIHKIAIKVSEYDMHI